MSATIFPTRGTVVPKTNIIDTRAAPTGGLNVRDALGSMPPKDALILTNWIAQQYGVRCRKGYREYVTGLGAPCRTIFAYQPAKDAVSNARMFAATDSAIFDITDSTNSPRSVLTLSGSSDQGRFSQVMYTNTAGSFLLACADNGGYYTYSDAGWDKKTSGAEAGKISGIDPNDLVFVTSWKRRAWFVEKESTNAWYLPTDQITGTLRKFELGPFVKHGGKLSFITSWTIDAGEGIDDLVVFAFEGGDVLIYKGTDPSSASTFGLVGAYYIGAIPNGRRAYSGYGGDVLILSELGLQPLSYVTRGGQSILRTQSTDYLDKIQPRIADLVSQLSGYDGWDITLFAKENLLIVQVPPGPTETQQQYAMYTNNNTWCMFDGIPMICSGIVGPNMYIGTEDGRICQAFTGYFDNVALGQTIGNGISGVIQAAYSYFKFPGNTKIFHMLRPTFLASDRPGVETAIIVDFKAPSLSSAPVSAALSGSLWDASNFDTAIWNGVQNQYQEWGTVVGEGFAGSGYLVTNCVGDSLLIAISYMFEPGGPI